MKPKNMPYIYIGLFVAATAFVRYYIIPEWSLLIHLLVMMLQFGFLAAVWNYIGWLSKWLDKRMPFKHGIARRMVVQVGISIITVVPVLVTVMYMVFDYLPAYVNYRFLTLMFILIIIAVALLNFVFYGNYFFDEWQRSVEQNAKLAVQTATLEKEKSKIQYHHLKNQVNPHFLFNTLTSLDGLIQTNADLASEFVRHLSKVYRYVLEHKENELVTLDTELSFISHYIELLSIRYGDAIQFKIALDADGRDRRIVMVTLQMLIDNAIKHNSSSLQSPLCIDIWNDEDYLHVRNNKQERKMIEHSTKQGLAQLTGMYKYLSDKAVEIVDEEGFFRVKLPLL